MKRAPRLNIGFDLDGVLIRNPFASCVIPRLQRLLSGPNGFQAGTGGDVVLQRIGQAWRGRMATGDLASAYDWDGIYREVSRDLGADEAVEESIDVASWVRDCCTKQEHIEALPGARELLDMLSQAGHRLVVISNGYSAYQRPVLAALDLLTYFDEVITPEMVGFAKPDKRIFEAAGPLDIFLGDTLVHDVLGAKAAGVATVWVASQLPDELLALDPLERAVDAELASVIDGSLQASPHSHFHPEASFKSCLPDAVVTGMVEATELLQRWRPY